MFHACWVASTLAQATEEITLFALAFFGKESLSDTSFVWPLCCFLVSEGPCFEEKEALAREKEVLAGQVIHEARGSSLVHDIQFRV